MKLRSTGQSVELQLTTDEAMSLAVLLVEASSVSQAEFYIRTGLSRSNIYEVTDLIKSAAKGEVLNTSIPIEEGVESVENPRRPRPSRGESA